MIEKNIYTTFGTKDVLQIIQHNYFNRPIYLAFDVDNNEHFQLIEYSENNKNPFVSGSKYNVLLTQNNSSDLRGLMAWNYLTLSDDEREQFILRTKSWMYDNKNENGLIDIFLLQIENGFDYAILTTWQTEKQFKVFKLKIDEFLKSFQYAPNVYLREKQFQFAKSIK